MDQIRASIEEDEDSIVNIVKNSNLYEQEKLICSLSRLRARLALFEYISDFKEFIRTEEEV